MAHGGHVQMIAAGNYTVSGLSRHVRLGEFVGLILIWVGFAVCVRAPLPATTAVGAA